MNEDLNDIDDLIAKVITGEATPEEKLQLKSWESLSGENQKYSNHIKMIFEKAAGTPGITVDTDAAWERVRSTIKAEKEPHSVWLGWRMAASILLIITVAFFTYRWFQLPVRTFAVQSDATVIHDTLPDGSTAFLNKQSSISFEYNPSEKTRKVKLKGEGFFEVKHEEEKPFIIEAGELMVRDIGTSFNVKAYPGNDSVEVIVQTGVVQIYTAEDPGIELQAGQTGYYSKKTMKFFRAEVSDVNALAYKTGVFSFNNTDLASVIDKINDAYGSKIKFENPALASCRLTVNFNNDSLDTIVEVIAETLKLTVTKKGKEIVLSGSPCN